MELSLGQRVTAIHGFSRPEDGELAGQRPHKHDVPPGTETKVRT